MSSRTLKIMAAVALVAASLVAPIAKAAVVSGTFSGVARDALLFSGGPLIPTFDGASVTGTFRVDTGLVGSPTPQSPEFVSYVLAGNALQLSFTVLGNTYVFGTQGLDSAATVYNDGTGQGVTFLANFLGQTDTMAVFGLGGNLPSGATDLFVDGLDLSTFHAAPVDLTFASAAFQLSFEKGARLELSDVRFDAMQVPEPAAWILLLSGLAVLAWQRRRL